MSKRYGRVRQKLANMIVKELDKAGVVVRVGPENLIPNQGYWRIDYRADVMPWTGFGEIKLKGCAEYSTICVESWDIMSDLIRGFKWRRDGLTIELIANISRPHPENVKAAARKAAFTI